MCRKSHLSVILYFLFWTYTYILIFLSSLSVLVYSSTCSHFMAILRNQNKNNDDFVMLLTWLCRFKSISVGSIKIDYWEKYNKCLKNNLTQQFFRHQYFMQFYCDSPWGGGVPAIIKQYLNNYTIKYWRVYWSNSCAFFKFLFFIF